MYETYVTVRGTLITAPNRKRMQDGTPLVHFRVASNERRYDPASGSWGDGDTLYLSVTCWRKLAENVHASFVTGDPVLVYGRLFTRSYEKDGRRLSVQELEAVSVGPDLLRSTAVVTRTNGRPAIAGETEIDRSQVADEAEPSLDAPQVDAAERVPVPAGGA